MGERSHIKNAIRTFGLDSDIKLISNRNEMEFFELLNCVISGFNQGTNNTLKIVPQYTVGKYRIDYAIVMYLGKDREESLELLIEFDERHHNYTSEKDNMRERQLREMIFDKYNCAEFNIFMCRVNESNLLQALSDIISFLNSNSCLQCIEGSYVPNTFKII